MTVGSTRASALLFLGDVVVFASSLWITLFLRYGTPPSESILALHEGPFAFLFIVWLLVFFMSGLYEKRVLFFKRDLTGRIVRTQIVNIVLAALFFFLIPAFGITPKTNLFIYLVVSLVLITAWRLFVFPRITDRRSRVSAVMIGSGTEVSELEKELRGNSRYGIQLRNVFKPKDASLASIHDVQLLIVDTRDPDVAPLVPELYKEAFEKGSHEIVDLLKLYEEVFDRVPISLLTYDWFFRYASKRVPGFYLVAKRMIDILGGLLMGIITVILTPFIWVAMLLEGPGPLFIKQVRIGEREMRVSSYKFRTMLESDKGAWHGESKNKVTKVGSFLRRTSLDEFPQFINVLSGELSLIGPRNDIEGLGTRLAEALPYYRVRYMVKPGITGWAQVNQQYEQGNISPQSIEETKLRLAYDFYYVKHRSFLLDIVIALKTVKRMLFRVSNW